MKKGGLAAALNSAGLAGAEPLRWSMRGLAGAEPLRWSMRGLAGAEPLR